MTLGANSAVAAKSGVVLDLAAVEVFERTFREGMDLVQEASTYLDGSGRMEARRLGREAASDYAAESMRLTTRLMQVSSWLLVQKAVRDGETPAAAAADPRYRLGEARPGRSRPGRLPDALEGLSQRADRLFERTSRLDRHLYLEVEVSVNSVASQIDRLRAAFAG
jgi:regulator of CtrA degradation